MDFSRLDSSRLEYRHLDYFGLKGHLDYKDIQSLDHLLIYFELSRYFWAILCQFVYLFRAS